MDDIYLSLHFYPDGSPPEPEKAYVGTITGDEKTEPELLASLATVLDFPDYFGHNWDALNELLRDLWWLRKRDVVLIHKKLPTLPDGELKTYLEILIESVRDWAEDEAHRLIVWFPQESKAKITKILGDTPLTQRATSLDRLMGYR